MNRFPKIQSQKLLKERLEFPFEKEIETMDRLPKIQGHKIVAKTLRFFIGEQVSNYG